MSQGEVKHFMLGGLELSAIEDANGDFVIQTSAGAVAGVGGCGRSATITRTNDTNAYNAGDVIGAATGSSAAVELANMGASGAEILLTSAALLVQLSSLISGMTSFKLQLYNVNPASALGDNAPWSLADADRSSYLGSISLGTLADVGANLWAETTQNNKQVTLLTTSLWAYLVTDGAFTPSASIVFKPALHAVAL